MPPRPPLASSTCDACSLHSSPDIPEPISDNPRIKALLECNDLPLEAERLSLLATVSSSSELLAVLKEKIDNDQQMLKMLFDGQAKVTGNVLAAKALLHPIRSVPDDVLSYIFPFCVHEVYDLLNEKDPPNSLDSRKPPWTLSQVCRSWRRVALSTASLWSCISLNFEHYRGPVHVHLYPFMLSLYIQRARHHQLTIRLSSTKDISSHVLTPVLLSSMPYWKHLRACMPAKSLEAFSTYRGYLESLHYLELRQPSWQDQANSPVHAFEMAHSLRILNINSGLGHHICLPDGGNGLTNLTIYGGSVKNMCILWGNTPNIETLGLHIQMSRPFERLNSPIMTHIKNLEDLTISAQIIDEDLFSALTRSNNDGDILPQLLTFDLQNPESIPDHKILLQMVESRMQDQREDGKQEEGVIGLRKIEEVYLDKPLTFDDPSLASCWQALQSNGLVVYYRD